MAIFNGKAVTVDSIVAPFMKLVDQLDVHVKNQEAEVASCTKIIVDANARILNAEEEKAKANNVITNFKAIFSTPTTNA